MWSISCPNCGGKTEYEDGGPYACSYCQSPFKGATQNAILANRLAVSANKIAHEHADLLLQKQRIFMVPNFAPGVPHNPNTNVVVEETQTSFERKLSEIRALFSRK